MTSGIYRETVFTEESGLIWYVQWKHKRMIEGKLPLCFSRITRLRKKKIWVSFSAYPFVTRKIRPYLKLLLYYNIITNPLKFLEIADQQKLRRNKCLKKDKHIFVLLNTSIFVCFKINGSTKSNVWPSYSNQVTLLLWSPCLLFVYVLHLKYRFKWILKWWRIYIWIYILKLHPLKVRNCK